MSTAILIFAIVPILHTEAYPRAYSTFGDLACVNSDNGHVSLFQLLHTVSTH